MHVCERQAGTRSMHIDNHGSGYLGMAGCFSKAKSGQNIPTFNPH